MSAESTTPDLVELSRSLFAAAQRRDLYVVRFTNYFDINEARAAAERLAKERR